MDGLQALGVADLWLPAWLVLAVALAGMRFQTLRHSLLSLEDPRTFAGMRIGFSLMAIWCFVSMSEHFRLLFSDEGLYLLPTAQMTLGRSALSGWSPGTGFDGLAGIWTFLTERPSLFLLWGSPAFVERYMFVLVLVLVLYGIGVMSRITGVLAWLLVSGAYYRNSAFIAGSDTVLMCFLFPLLFARTGAAWSVDNAIRCHRLRRRGELGAAAGERAQPVYRLVPAWPRYVLMFQLAVIYVTTGIAKFGPEWAHGDTLYYAVNNMTFYRFEGFTQQMSALFATNIFRLNTWVTLWWEQLFFVIVLGRMLRFGERHRNEPFFQAETRGLRGFVVRLLWLLLYLCTWRIHYLSQAHPRVSLHLGYGVIAPACVALYALLPAQAPTAGPTFWRRLGRVLNRPTVTRFVLGRRLWLGLGLLFHGFLAVFMNLGMFPFIMMVTYLAFIPGDELCRVARGVWHLLQRRVLRRPATALATPPWLAPAEDSDGRPARPAFGRVAAPLFAAAAAYHCIAIFLVLYQPAAALALSSARLSRALHVDAYKQATHIRQHWDMFSRPRLNNDALITQVVDRSGGVHTLPNNLFAEKRPVELHWERMRKLRLRITKRSGRGFRPYWALYHCREWALAHDGELPRQVVLYRRYSRIPSVAWVRKHGAFRSQDLATKEERLGTYACRGDGRLPAYMKERYGLPLDAADARRAAYVERRLLDTFPPPQSKHPE